MPSLPRLPRGMREVITRYWPLWLLGVGFYVVVVVFASYLAAKQHAAEARAEKQRRDICAILANIPGRIPPEIAAARHDFARPDHPRDCLPVVHPTPAVTVTPRVIPGPTSTVIVVTPTAVTVTRRPQPTRTRRPTPTPTPTRTPAPSPSPSRSCLLIICR